MKVEKPWSLGSLWEYKDKLQNLVVRVLAGEEEGEVKLW
jgi:hypothetical protein